MIDILILNIFNFGIAAVLYFVVVFYSYAFIKGALPLTGWSFQVGSSNKVLFGDKSVNPYFLKGFRARWVSLALIFFSVMFLIVIAPQNDSIINPVISNGGAIIAGFILGVVGYRKAHKIAEEKFW